MNKDIQKKVQDKLDNEKATDIVNQIKRPDVKKLKTDIPDNPFDAVESEDEILPDDGDDDDLWYEPNDEDGLPIEKWEKVEKMLADLGWGLEEEAKTISELMYEKETYLLRGFYCYVISEMRDEQIGSYMQGFHKLMNEAVIWRNTEDLPNEIKVDEVVMDFRKKQIEDDAKRLSDYMIKELLMKLDMLKNDDLETST
tara:strand:+ start:815 stop:1408 length:594 start_codon:yes stop_codon:yes gene_type:complete